MKTVTVELYSFEKNCGADRATSKIITLHNQGFVPAIGDTTQWVREGVWWSGQVRSRAWNLIDQIAILWLENTVRISR